MRVQRFLVSVALSCAAVFGVYAQAPETQRSPLRTLRPVKSFVTVTDQTKVKVEGADKQLVGAVTAEIRSFYPPEPYKGKGVRIVGERVRRKEGKTVA